MALTLSHSQFGGAIRYVNYTSNISVDGNTYTAVAMEIREPPVSAEASNAMSILIDGVSGELQPKLYNASQLPEPVYATLKPFGYNITTSSSLGVVGTINLEMESAAVTAGQIVLSCGVLNSANLPFPNITYTPETHPGIF
jgi:hypothetical protein